MSTHISVYSLLEGVGVNDIHTKDAKSVTRHSCVKACVVAES